MINLARKTCPTEDGYVISVVALAVSLKTSSIHASLGTFAVLAIIRPSM